MFRGKFLAAKTSHKKLAAISSHKIRFDTECKFLKSTLNWCFFYSFLIEGFIN